MHIYFEEFSDLKKMDDGKLNNEIRKYPDI